MPGQFDYCIQISTFTAICLYFLLSILSSLCEMSIHFHCLGGLCFKPQKEYFQNWMMWFQVFFIPTSRHDLYNLTHILHKGVQQCSTHHLYHATHFLLEFTTPIPFFPFKCWGLNSPNLFPVLGDKAINPIRRGLLPIIRIPHHYEWDGCIRVYP